MKNNHPPKLTTCTSTLFLSSQTHKPCFFHNQQYDRQERKNTNKSTERLYRKKASHKPMEVEKKKNGIGRLTQHLSHSLSSVRDHIYIVVERWFFIQFLLFLLYLTCDVWCFQLHLYDVQFRKEYIQNKWRTQFN